MCKKSEPVRRTVFDKRRYRREDFLRELERCPWHLMDDLATPDEMLSFFKHCVESSIMKVAPLKDVYIRNLKTLSIINDEWFDDECRQKLREKCKAFKEFCDRPSDNLEKNYKEKKEEFLEEIGGKESEYSKQVFENLRTSKSKWQFINDARGTKRYRKLFQF